MLEMTEEARDLFFDFDYDTESRLTEDYECIEPFAGKVSGTVLRMAGILHYAAHGPRALRSASAVRPWPKPLTWQNIIWQKSCGSLT